MSLVGMPGVAAYKGWTLSVRESCAMGEKVPSVKNSPTCSQVICRSYSAVHYELRSKLLPCPCHRKTGFMLCLVEFFPHKTVLPSAEWFFFLNLFILNPLYKWGLSVSQEVINVEHLIFEMLTSNLKSWVKIFNSGLKYSSGLLILMKAVPSFPHHWLI